MTKTQMKKKGLQDLFFALGSSSGHIKRKKCKASLGAVIELNGYKPCMSI